MNMVTKKATPKKRTSKSSTAKTTAAKSAKRVVRSKKQAAEMRSFKIYRDVPSFTTFRVTRQTVYWTILLLFIILMQLWILQVQLEIAALTESLISQ
jgi:hypothetical protein